MGGIQGYSQIGMHTENIIGSSHDGVGEILHKAPGKRCLSERRFHIGGGGERTCCPSEKSSTCELSTVGS